MLKHLFYFLALLLLATACKPVSQIQTGDDAFQYKRYPEAVKMLTEEVEKSKIKDEQARKSYWIGESYRLMNQDEASIKWYRKAYDLSPNQISLEAYANAVLRSQQYSNAKVLYTKLIADYGVNELWQNAVKSCDAAALWIGEQIPGQFTIKKSTVNSAVSDYAPVYYSDILVFTSDRTDSKGKKYHWTGNQYADFYRTGEDDKLDNLLTQINGPYNEAAITFSKGLDRAIYTQCGADEEEGVLEDHCRLIEAIWSEEESAWTTFRELDFCEPNVNYGHPTFFDDDRSIIFSSDDIKGMGGRDLWVARYNGNKWERPVRLPAGINSTGNEVFPQMQGDTLFYSSDGLVGMGGLDIYFCKQIPPNGWTLPVNLKPPINSGGDDFSYVADPTFTPDRDVIRRFMITSNRKGSLQDDLYTFEENRLVPMDSVIVEEDDGYEIVIEGRVFEQLYADPSNPNSAKLKTKPLPGVDIVVKDRSKLTVPSADSTGRFQLRLKEEGSYRFIANHPGYLSNSQYVDVRLNAAEREAGTKTYIVNIILDPIVYNTEIVLENIYYDFDKWAIREDARPALDELGELLVDNPSIRIELASHTDCRGLEIYNAELSQKRAKSAVNYLESLGIDKGRMRAVGYGEQRPAVECECDDCTEEQHQANRRTTFTILR